MGIVFTQEETRTAEEEIIPGETYPEKLRRLGSKKAEKNEKNVAKWIIDFKRLWASDLFPQLIEQYADAKTRYEDMRGIVLWAISPLEVTESIHEQAQKPIVEWIQSLGFKAAQTRMEAVEGQLRLWIGVTVE